MKIPPEMTEAQVLTQIDEVVRRLAPKFKFGCHAVEDIEQQGRIFALECLDRYDHTRPLDVFLRCHVRNRLVNFKRDNFTRYDSPCKICEHAHRPEDAHPGTGYCQRYLKWKKRNSQKAAVRWPSSMENRTDGSTYDIESHREANVSEALSTVEIRAIIDDKLDVHLRAVYLQMRAGENVPRQKREEVEIALKEILREVISAAA